MKQRAQFFAERSTGDHAEDQEEQIFKDDCPDLQSGKTGCADTKQTDESDACFFDVLKAEQNPADIDDKQCVNMCKQKEREVEGAPQYVIPAGAVSHAGQQPNDCHIEYETARAAAVAAERDVDIIPEKRAQRDMPPAPEILYGRCRVRVVEVFQIMETDHTSHTYSHVGVG